MKQLLSMVVIAGMVTIMFSSCAKEEPWHASALISQPGNPAPTQSSANFELVANKTGSIPEVSYTPIRLKVLSLQLTQVVTIK